MAIDPLTPGDLLMEYRYFHLEAMGKALEVIQEVDQTFASLFGSLPLQVDRFYSLQLIWASHAGSRKSFSYDLKILHCDIFVKGVFMLAHPHFFPLTLPRNERGEGPSRTLNKGVALPWLSGGLLSLCWLISNSPPLHCGTRAVTPWQGDCPPIQRA